MEVGETFGALVFKVGLANMLISNQTGIYDPFHVKLCVKKIVKHQFAHSLGSFATRYGYGIKSCVPRSRSQDCIQNAEILVLRAASPQVLIHTPYTHTMI